MPPRFGPEIGIRKGDLIADKYRVDRILGVGGMGVVVAAYHLRLDEVVAIKLLLPEALADADAMRRFEREARAAVKIKSEHASRIIDVGTLDGGAPFIVMEYLEGEDLADRIARVGPIPVKDAITLILQACEAIAEAHAIGIVHRDLKPANLFCAQGADGRPSIKVLDFGISKLTRASALGSGLGMTKTRAVMGSPFYMSPEQMESPRTVDARTDIWSLGVVLYQLLTGEVPFGGETLPQVCVNVATRPAPSLRKSRPDVPSGLELICLRCLEKDPNQRFPTIAALATALARFGPKQAQVSLDRITQRAMPPDARRSDDTHPQNPRATDRPVTGPLPSWGATAKSRENRTRSVIGWMAAGLIVISAGFTFVFLRPSKRQPAASVLITPPRGTAPREMATEVPSSPPREMPKAAAVPTVATIPTRAAPAAPPPPREDPPLAAPAVTEVNPYGPAPEAMSSAAPAPTCWLNLSSLPPSHVVLDGRPLGWTPKNGVAVTAGEHRVLFRWEDGDKRTNVICEKGETKTIAVRPDDGAPTNTDSLPEKNPYR
jgi:serine/threonine-protein kinase